jgi:hypothetical protein
MNQFESASAPLKNFFRMVLQNFVGLVFCSLAAILCSCSDASAQGLSYVSATGESSACSPIYINGVDSSASGQADNSGTFEASLKFFAVGLQIVAIVWGTPTVVAGVINMAAGKQDALNKVILGAFGILSASMANGCVSWLVG